MSNQVRLLAIAGALILSFETLPSHGIEGVNGVEKTIHYEGVIEEGFSSPQDGEVSDDAYLERIFQVADALSSTSQTRTANFSILAKSMLSSLLNFTLDARGFDFSKEGACVALQEKFKTNSKEAKELVTRKLEDQGNLEFVTCVMQIASLGGDAKGERMETAKNKLVELAGTETAAELCRRLRSIHSQQKSAQFDEKPLTDVLQRRDRLESILALASRNDPEILNLTARLHKYNHRSKVLQLSAKVAYTTLGAAAFTPTLVAPIAEGSLLAFMYATGGPEQDKLLKELYLSRCLQSRVDLINEKAHLALDCYDISNNKRNAPLHVCAKGLIRQMTNQPEILNDVKFDPEKGELSSNSTVKKVSVSDEAFECRQ